MKYLALSILVLMLTTPAAQPAHGLDSVGDLGDSFSIVVSEDAIFWGFVDEWLAVAIEGDHGPTEPPTIQDCDVITQSCSPVPGDPERCLITSMCTVDIGGGQLAIEHHTQLALCEGWPRLCGDFTEPILLPSDLIVWLAGQIEGDDPEIIEPQDPPAFGECESITQQCQRTEADPTRCLVTTSCTSKLEGGGTMVTFMLHEVDCASRQDVCADEWIED